MMRTRAVHARRGGTDPHVVLGTRADGLLKLVKLRGNTGRYWPKTPRIADRHREPDPRGTADDERTAARRMACTSTQVHYND